VGREAGTARKGDAVKIVAAAFSAAFVAAGFAALSASTAPTVVSEKNKSPAQAGLFTAYFGCFPAHFDLDSGIAKIFTISTQMSSTGYACQRQRLARPS